MKPMYRLSEPFLQRSNDETHVPLIRAIPAKELNGLIGIVNWGGDAVDDTERLFEE